MNVINNGVTINEIPHFERIMVSDDAITLDDGESAEVYTISAITELRDALSLAIEHAERMTVTYTPKRKPRVWEDGDPEPEGVTKVRDRDDQPGYAWHRRPNGSGWKHLADDWSYLADDESMDSQRWEYVVSSYGPLTEVLDD